MSPDPPEPEKPAPVVRRYEPRDRAAVRTICCDTADCGGPVEHFFPDREVFADLLVRYYTDYEPASSWVVEGRRQIAGYLTGCTDTRRFGRTMVRRILPQLLAKVLIRGTLLRGPARRFIALNGVLWLRRGATNPADTARYPAHFHVNLEPAFRAHHAGTALVDSFLTYLRSEHVPGVHVNVREDNARGRAFFGRIGFTAVSRHPTMRMSARPDEVLHSIRYGMRL